MSAPDAPGALVLSAVDGGVATLTLNRPERLNTITADLVRELRAGLERVSIDDGVRVVVLTGAGAAFCAGADLAQTAGSPPGGGGGSDEDAADGGAARSAGSIADEMTRLVATARLLHTMSKITIAAVNGACAGGGLSWATACDLRFAADTAVFNTAFLQAGVPGDYGVTWTLPRVVGPGRARDLMLRPRRVDAGEAEQIGLVTEVFPAADLAAEVATIAAGIAGAAPLALSAMKANLNDGLTHTLDESLIAEIERAAPCLASDDMREAARAFREKRPPVFRGR